MGAGVEKVKIGSCSLICRLGQLGGRVGGGGGGVAVGGWVKNNRRVGVMAAVRRSPGARPGTIRCDWAAHCGNTIAASLQFLGRPIFGPAPAVERRTLLGIHWPRRALVFPTSPEFPARSPADLEICRVLE